MRLKCLYLMFVSLVIFSAEANGELGKTRRSILSFSFFTNKILMVQQTHCENVLLSFVVTLERIKLKSTAIKDDK